MKCHFQLTLKRSLVLLNDKETRLEKFLMITSKDSKTISFVRLRKESSPTANAGKPVIVNMDASVT